jgi:hypothetical protein
MAKIDEDMRLKDGFLTITGMQALARTHELRTLKNLLKKYHQAAPFIRNSHMVD